MPIPVITIVAACAMVGRTITRQDPFEGRPFDPERDSAWDRFDVRVAGHTRELKENLMVCGLAFLADVLVLLIF